MKNKIIILTLFSVIVLLSSSPFYSINPPVKKNNNIQEMGNRYLIEQLMVKFLHSGDMINGSSILYFDEFGKREAKYEKTEVKMGPMSVEDE